jgi:hypothetical protein
MRRYGVRLVRWLGDHDRGFAALRRAGRAAIVMPALFAMASLLLGNPTVATFAAFGSFAMLLLVDFTGPMSDRLKAQLALALVGAVNVAVGTLASNNAWLAASAMSVVAFVVLFLGVVSSELVSATPALLLSFILPVSLPGPASTIPDRLAGWGLASVAALFAVALLWPTPTLDPLRGPATAASRALAARLRSDAAYGLGGEGAPSDSEHDRVTTEADAAVAALHAAFLATPYRPTGLSTARRQVVRLVDELGWLSRVVSSHPRQRRRSAQPATCAVRAAAAVVLDRGGDLLSVNGGHLGPLHEAVAALREAVTVMERDAAVDASAIGGPSVAAPSVGSGRVEALIAALDPSFCAQELSYAVLQIGSNIELTAAAERRPWLDRIRGRQPRGVPGTLSAAHVRATTHIQPGSVWLHNSVRGAIGLGLAVLVANLSGVQHSFWVVLGTLSVLRSNALSTGQSVARGLLGTVVGSIVGAALLVPVGSNTTILWFLLPPAILFAGVLPAAISFTAGQAAFTVTLVIVFNIVAPTGWLVGLLRVEDVALGCAVSLVVGMLFWPRGATAALSRTLADAYRAGARYLAEAVAFGMLRCGTEPLTGVTAHPPTEESARAAAAARRLDDAFRNYLAERGSKPTSLAETTRLVNGVVALRLAGDAVLDLWRRDDDLDGIDRRAATAELLANAKALVDWYDALAASLVGDRESPVPPPERDEQAAARLVDALSHDLLRSDGGGGLTASRMIWTGDYLDSLSRAQAVSSGSSALTSPGSRN